MLIGAAVVVRGLDQGDSLRLTAVVVAVTGITQTSLSSPVTPIFWVLLGIALQPAFRPLQVDNRGAAWSPSQPRRGRGDLQPGGAPGRTPVP